MQMRYNICFCQHFKSDFVTRKRLVQCSTYPYAVCSIRNVSYMLDVGFDWACIEYKHFSVRTMSSNITLN